MTRTYYKRSTKIIQIWSPRTAISMQAQLACMLKCKITDTRNLGYELLNFR